VRTLPRLLATVVIVGSALFLAVSPVGDQGARCLANHVFKDDQCSAAAFRTAVAGPAWRTHFRSPRRVLANEWFDLTMAVEPWPERLSAMLRQWAPASGL
jgi:hypothetical protein